MKKRTKYNIARVITLSVIGLFFTGVGYLIFINDPVVEREYETDDPNTSLILREHIKTGKIDYIYGVVDGVGNINP